MLLIKNECTIEYHKSRLNSLQNATKNKSLLHMSIISNSCTHTKFHFIIHKKYYLQTRKITARFSKLFFFFIFMRNIMNYLLL